MAASSSSLPSPSSDQRFWNTLRGRVETLLENRNPVSPAQNGEGLERRNRLTEDSMLLLRGFDSVAHSLSQLSNNLETALKGARDLGKPHTLTEIVHDSIKKAKREGKEEVEEEEEEEEKRGLKRKLDLEESSSDKEEEEKNKCQFKLDKIKKAKNMAMAMATKAATMARELKSIRSDLSFMQERCALLEEENRKLRDGMEAGEEDDLVRLQLEALLAEKSRLASENANLKRENQSLHQLVEYHQVTSEDLSASYETLVRGMGLGFDFDDDIATTPSNTDFLGFAKSLDQCFDDEQEDK